jgi:hypothetical protein
MARYVIRMEQMLNAYIILFGKPEAWKQAEKRRRNPEVNVKINAGEMRWEVT